QATPNTPTQPATQPALTPQERAAAIREWMRQAQEKRRLGRMQAGSPAQGATPGEGATAGPTTPSVGAGRTPGLPQATPQVSGNAPTTPTTQLNSTPKTMAVATPKQPPAAVKSVQIVHDKGR